MRKGWLIALLALLLCLACTAASADGDFLIDNRKITLFEGQSVQLNLLRQGEALGEGQLTWTSSSMKVASVDPNGVVTAQSKGVATITAVLKVGKRTFQSTANITVQRAVTDLTVNETALTVVNPDDPLVAGRLLPLNGLVPPGGEPYPEGASLPVLVLYAGQNENLRATVTPKDASVTTVTLTSADENVLKTGQGSLRPLKAGQTILTVASTSNPSVMKQYQVFVAQKVTKLEVSASKKAIGVGGTLLLHVQVTPADATWKDVTWTSQTPRILSVTQNGQVTGLAKGEGHIRVTANDGSKRSAEFIVRVEQLPTGITVREDRLTILSESDPQVANLLEMNADLPVLVMRAGDNATIMATVSPDNANNKKFVLTLDNPALARVNGGNLLHALAAGETFLTVSAEADPDVKKEYHLLILQPVTKVTVSASKKVVAVGGTCQVTASIEPYNATWKDVTWSSRNTNVLSVDQNGIVTGLARGEGRIRATANDGSGRMGEITISVEQQPTTITITGKNSVVVGHSLTLQANVEPRNANNKRIIWSTSNPNVATVSANGRVTGVHAGTCFITCTSEVDGMVSASWRMDVVQLVEKINFALPSVSLNVNETAKVFWSVEPNSATDKSVTLTSNNTKVATVDPDGTIHGWKRGECTITAKANDGSGKTARVKVSVLQPVLGVHMYNDTVTVDVDERVTLRAELEPSDASNKHMTWSIADPTIATISGTTNRPQVRGIRWGTTYATGVTEDGGFVVYCTIRVGSYPKALRIDDFYVQNNQIKIRVKNLSNMTITRFFFTIECYDAYNIPLICTVDNFAQFSGYYLDTLYEGQSTTHGRFRFTNYANPIEPIGRVVIRLTGYRCADGFSYTYRVGSQPEKEFQTAAFITPTPEPTATPEPTEVPPIEP